MSQKYTVYQRVSIWQVKSIYADSPHEAAELATNDSGWKDLEGGEYDPLELEVYDEHDNLLINIQDPVV